MYAQVAIAYPLPALTYLVPPGLKLSIGQPVKVQLRKKLVDGIVVELLPELPAAPKFEIREIHSLSDEYPVLDAEAVRLLEWTSDYYQYPLGEVLKTFLPPDPEPRKKTAFRLTVAGKEKLAAGNLPRGKQQRAVLEQFSGRDSMIFSGEQRAAARKLCEAGWLESFSQEDETMPVAAGVSSEALNLTEHQAEAFHSIGEAIDRKKFECFLLEGITGSGKTEVYLRAAEKVLQKGYSVLVVVPEISLTPQLLSRFRSRLGENIALLHSGISDGERSHQWHQLNKGAYRICLGARSAALAPMKNLGLVIVDEEHDSALKQEDHLRYNARDLAIVRASHQGCPVVLGSATPSLETFHRASVGKYRHLRLPERARGQSLPHVTVIDRTQFKSEESITPPLRNAIRDTLSTGGQVMLLLNRRGFSSFLICTACGVVPECPNCSVSLTNYKNSNLLKCHYCGHSESVPPSCRQCQQAELLPGTLGTEALEEEVRALFPGVPTLRIDRESMERKGSLDRALEAIAKREVQIVIGTQIIAKGHDFPEIGLVGVVNADSSFHLPDFRASERSFQLFTQMAGRAGRGTRPGRVFLQTFNPRHPSIVLATHHDYRSFAEEELRLRHGFSYPPFTRMARLIISAPNSQLAEAASERCAAMLQRKAASLKIELIGPAPALLSKVQNRYRWSLLLKCASASALHSLLRAQLSGITAALDKRVVVQVDVVPLSLM
jgi:primosomal protein N' (replication factor Y)